MMFPFLINMLIKNFIFYRKEKELIEISLSISAKTLLL